MPVAFGSLLEKLDVTDISVDKVQIASNECGYKIFNEIHFFIVVFISSTRVTISGWSV